MFDSYIQMFDLNIHDDALRGILTAELLKRYLSDDRSIIDSPGGRKSLTPLAAATLRGHLDVVRLLLENPIRPADPDALSSNNRTPLFFATSRSPAFNRGAIVRLLLDNGANVDLCYADDNYNTPLMNAIFHLRDKGVVQLLISCGASLTKRNAQGDTAVTLAKKKGMEADLEPQYERTPSKEKTPESTTLTLQNDSRVPSGSKTMMPLEVEYTFSKNAHFCLDGRIIRDNPNPLGGGGFADVYQGLFECRKVAIKVVRHFGLRQEKLLRRLWREYLAWAHLSHPNILACLGYAYDFSSGAYALPSLISPWMENGTCLSYLETHPDADRSDLLIGIGYGLHYLHTREPVIVHGDLRAGNVLISDQGVPCLTDFGLSRVLEEIKGMTTSSDIAGSLRWMSPELFESDSKVSIQSDVWAYGMTILEILTGQHPYLEEKHDLVVFGLVSRGKVPRRPRGVDGQELIDDKMWAACRHCWFFSPASRPSIRAVVTMIRTVRRPPSDLSSSIASSSPAIFDTPLATEATNDLASDESTASEGPDNAWAALKPYLKVQSKSIAFAMQDVFSAAQSPEPSLNLNVTQIIMIVLNIVLVCKDSLPSSSLKEGNDILRELNDHCNKLCENQAMLGINEECQQAMEISSFAIVKLMTSLLKI